HAAFAAGALALAATGDFFTASLVTLHYVLSIALALLAAWALLRWAGEGALWALFVAPLQLRARLLFPGRAAAPFGRSSSTRSRCSSASCSRTRRSRSPRSARCCS